MGWQADGSFRREFGGVSGASAWLQLESSGTALSATLMDQAHADLSTGIGETYKRDGTAPMRLLSFQAAGESRLELQLNPAATVDAVVRFPVGGTESAPAVLIATPIGTSGIAQNAVTREKLGADVFPLRADDIPNGLIANTHIAPRTITADKLLSDVNNANAVLPLRAAQFDPKAGGIGLDASWINRDQKLHLDVIPTIPADKVAPLTGSDIADGTLTAADLALDARTQVSQVGYHPAVKRSGTGSISIGRDIFGLDDSVEFILFAMLDSATARTYTIRASNNGSVTLDAADGVVSNADQVWLCVAVVILPQSEVS